MEQKKLKNGENHLIILLLLYKKMMKEILRIKNNIKIILKKIYLYMNQ